MDMDKVENPREMSNLGTMVCSHKRYTLGDPGATLPDGYGFSDWNSLAEADKAAKKQVTDRGGVLLPLYMYDHGGITIGTKPFSCPFDSGRIGWIYVTRERILGEYGGKRITTGLRKLVTNVLQSEVEAYDRYLQS